MTDLECEKNIHKNEEDDEVVKTKQKIYLKPLNNFNEEPTQCIDKLWKNILSKYIPVKILEYINGLRNESKTLTLSVHGRSQLIYVLFMLKNIAIEVRTIPDKGITDHIINSLDPRSNLYKFYKYIVDVTKGMTYTEEGEDIEENLLNFIEDNFNVEDEDLIQYITELYINFLKRFSKIAANDSWCSNKSINDKTTNTILRNLDIRGMTDPDIFLIIYEFSDYVKTNSVKQNRVKKTCKKII
jgi:hypothetical protein